MKRYGHLFEKAFTPQALYLAYLDARQGKRSTRACFNFEKCLGTNLYQLHQELHDGSYTVKPYYSFMVYEPKPRQIFAPAFRDTVVQHAIYRLVYPLFDKTFIDQSFACRKGKGTHKAAQYAQDALRASPRNSYTLKLDIRKFFYRIDRQILRTQVERVIKDRRFVDLMMAFAQYGEPVGIPIGNLLSQIYALIYLNPLDHFVKRQLKVRHYCRYVDDFVLFGLTRAQCVEYKERIERFIATELNLEFSKYTIAPVSKGVNFVGYRTWASRRFIRKHSLYNFRRAVRDQKLASVVSILGHARHTHSFNSLIASLKEQDHALHRQLPKVYRYRSHSRDRTACRLRGPAHWGGAGHNRRGDVCQPARRSHVARPAASRSGGQYCQSRHGDVRAAGAAQRYQSALEAYLAADD